MRQTKPLNIKRQLYTMMSAANEPDSVEVTFYGDVIDERPIDWWTGEPIEGDFIAAKDFIEDLDRLEGYKNVTFRINSYGGDSTSGILIHNRIKDMKAHTTAIIDGVAMSAASIIAIACDEVKMNPASLLMIHRNWSFLWGGYNADNIKEALNMLEGYDGAAAAAYAKKSGMTEKQCLKMMADVTYMTGREAVEKGFADSLIEDAEPLELSASAEGRSIFCKGREIHLAPGMFAPDSIPTKADTTDTTAPSTDAVVGVDDANKSPDVSGREEVQPMTLEELRAAYPELTAEIEASATAGMNDAVNSAVLAERTRLQGIDEIASLFSDALVNDAKYGNPCNADALALRAAKEAKQSGTAFLAAIQNDSEESNSGDVNSASAPIDETDVKPLTQDEVNAQFAELMKD